MGIQNWSDEILLVELADDPQFTDDMNALSDLTDAGPPRDVVLNFAGVNYLNSSNIAKLLKLRKSIAITQNRKLMLCGIDTHVWGVFLVTGLDKVFEFADDTASGLAMVQMGR